MRFRMVCVLLGAVLLASGAAAPAAGADAAFRFAILSDRTGGHVPGIYPRVIDEINLLGPDIVVTVGDHIEGYTDDVEWADAEWDSLMGLLGRLEAPVYVTPGNHDIWSDTSEEVYVRRTSRRPHYSFDYADAHFIILDNSRFESWDDLPEDQRLWLIADLEANRNAGHTFVFCHKPFWYFTLAVGKPDPLHDILVRYEIDAVFSGHFHYYFAGSYDGIDYASIGSSGGYMYHQDDQPVERGEFFQFGWVTVRESGYDLALIHLDGVYPPDVATIETGREILRIESELITTGRIPVTGTQPMTATVSIENVASRPVEDVIAWQIPDGWRVDPPVLKICVDPGESADYEFLLSNPGSLYPLPEFGLGYPMSNGRELAARISPRIVRRVVAERLDRGPIIDGNVTESCWSRVTPATELYPPYDDARLDEETSFYFACDNENLYLAAVCNDGDMDAVTADVLDRDGPVYSEDCVGYFLSPTLDGRVVYQFYFNPRGAIFDQRISFDEAWLYDVDRSWDGEYEVATHRTFDRWSIEVRIPRESLGLETTPGQILGANFRRKLGRTRGGIADWQVPIDYDPRTFGELVLN